MEKEIVIRFTKEGEAVVIRAIEDMGSAARRSGKSFADLQGEIKKLNSLNVRLGISEQLARDMANIRTAHQTKMNLMRQEAQARADLDRRMTQGADTALRRLQASMAAAQRQRFALERQLDQQNTTRTLQAIRTREAAERSASRTLEQQQRQQSRAVINGINEQIAKGRLAHAERTNWLKEEAALEKAVTDVAINQDKRKASAQKATHDQKMRDLRLQTQATLDAGRVQIQNDRVQRQLSRPAFVGGGGGRSGSGGGGRSGSGGGGRSGGFFGLGGTSSEVSRVRTAIESATIAALNFRTILYTLGVGFSLRGVLSEFRQLSDIQQKLTASFGKDKAPGMFDRLVGASNETGSALKENAFLLQRFRNATKDMNQGNGLSEETLLGLVKRFNELGRVSGATANEMQNAALQTSQVMNSGRAQGDELRSITENLPALFDAIAAASGLTRSELVRATRGTDEFGNSVSEAKKATGELLTVTGPFGQQLQVVGKESKDSAKFVGQNGKVYNVLKNDLTKAAQGMKTFGDETQKTGKKIITDLDIIKALGPASDKLVEKLKNIPLTIDQSFNVLSNNLFNLLNNFDRQTGIVGKLSEAVKILSDNVGLLSDAFIILGVVALPLVLAALAKLAVSLAFNFFGLLGVGLGVTTAYLIAFRNEVGFSAQGSLVFSNAVVTLAEAFRFLGDVMKNTKLSDWAEVLRFPFGQIGKSTADAYDSGQALAKTQATGQDKNIAVRRNQSIAKNVSQDILPSFGEFISNPILATAKIPTNALSSMWEQSSEKARIYYEGLQRIEQQEQRRIATSNRIAESMGQISKEQIDLRAEMLRTNPEMQKQLDLLKKSYGTKDIRPARQEELADLPKQAGRLANMLPPVIRLRDEQEKLLRTVAKEQLEIEQESLRVARAKAELRQKEVAATQQKPVDPFAQQTQQRATGSAIGNLQAAATQAGAKINSALKLDEIGPKLKSGIEAAIPSLGRLSSAASAAKEKFDAITNFAKQLDVGVTSVKREIAGTLAEVSSVLATVVGYIEEIATEALERIKKLVNGIITAINAIPGVGGKIPLVGDLGGQLGGPGSLLDRLNRNRSAAGDTARNAVPNSTFFQDRSFGPALNAAGGAFGQNYFQGQGPLTQDYQAELARTKAAIEGVQKAQEDVGRGAQQSYGQAANAMGQLGQASQDVGQLMQQFIGSTLSNLENAFVQFAQTGKIDFKSLMNSIIADLARMFFRMIIMQPIMMFFQSFLGGFGGGLFGFASGGLVGGGGGSFNSFGGGGGLNSLAPASTGGFSNFGGIGIGNYGGCGLGGCKGGFAAGGLVGDFKGFATGGMTSGPGTSTSDRLLTLTSPGEFIVNAAATKANLPVLNYINEGGTMGGGGGTAVSYAPNIVVNVQGGGSAVAGIQQGQMAGKELDAIMRKSFSEMLVRELRPGGTLNQG